MICGHAVRGMGHVYHIFTVGTSVVNHCQMLSVMVCHESWCYFVSIRVTSKLLQIAPICSRYNARWLARSSMWHTGSSPASLDDFSSLGPTEWPQQPGSIYFDFFFCKRRSRFNSISFNFLMQSQKNYGKFQGEVPVPHSSTYLCRSWLCSAKE